MNNRNQISIVFSLGVSCLLLVGLFSLVSGRPFNVLAVPGNLFVATNGSGIDCTQANPCTLWTALTQSTEGDTIYVAHGTYVGTGDAVIEITKSVTLLGGWDGTTITPLVRDPDIFLTVLDGENSRRVVYISGDIAPTLDGFTITRGDASSAAVDPGYGGGIYSSLAEPVIIHNQIINNNAYSSATEWGHGGGIYISRSNGLPESAAIMENQISNNTASSIYRGNGGGLEVYFSHAVVISDNTFQSNIAGSDLNGLGGGIALITSSAVVTGNWIQDNQASPETYGFGGGFYSENGDITLSGNQILNNLGAFGSVTFFNSPNITVTNNIIAHNSGGGVFIRGNASSPISGTLAHNTISQNGDNGICTGCSSPGYATLTLTNNIITGHTTGIFVYPDMNTSHVTATHTLFFDNDSNTEGATLTSTNEITGSDPHFLNPSLGDFHLWPNSPAIDAGTPISWLTTDIDGDPRPWPVGGFNDIGADEARWLPVYLPVLLYGSH